MPNEVARVEIPQNEMLEALKGSMNPTLEDAFKASKKPALISEIESNTQKDYRRLLKKYKEQQKMLNALKKEEKLALREKFKDLSSSGRRRKYTPIRMKNKIIDYFALIQATNRPPTKSGLMVHLKMHRDQFYAYSGYPEFKDIMEQTSQMMENWYEESLILNKYNGSGIQFALKNRFGWKDTQTVEIDNGNNEDMLVRKIEALAPELVGFFKTMNSINLEEPKQLESLVVIEGDYE